MSTLKSYRDLEFWKQSIDLAEQVYRLSARFPVDEKFGLISQVQLAVASVPANIAEGAEREGTKEFLQFLGIASGSLAETETFLILAVRLGLVSQAGIKPVLEQAGAVELGHLEQRHLAPIRKTKEWSHRRQGDQPPRGRGDEGVQGLGGSVPGCCCPNTTSCCIVNTTVGHHEHSARKLRIVLPSTAQAAANHFAGLL